MAMEPSTEHSGQVNRTLDDRVRHLSYIAHLLHQAAKSVYARADAGGPASPLHSLALGIYLVHSQAQLMLAEAEAEADRKRGRDPGLPPNVNAGLNRTAVHMLTEVEQLVRLLPPRRSGMSGNDQMLVDLCSLRLEAEHHGC